MSYILDALRKSEQQRQAIQPDTVTDRILINQPQPKQKLPKWIAALVIGNLLVIAYFVWFFTHKAPMESQHKVAENSEKQLLPLPVTQTQNRINKKPHQSLPKPPELASPSIAQWVDAKKETKKMADIQHSNKQLSEKKPLPVKKELSIHKLATAPKPEMLETIAEKPATLPPKQGIVAVDELPYEIRNNLPNLNINVFSYANQPEDRFVIIDMVKYRTGQLIKGSVKLKEILPNSIILQYGSSTFRIERP
jgi:general secretion pathway protein B